MQVQIQIKATILELFFSITVNEYLFNSLLKWSFFILFWRIE